MLSVKGTKGINSNYGISSCVKNECHGSSSETVLFFSLSHTIFSFPSFRSLSFLIMCIFCLSFSISLPVQIILFHGLLDLILIYTNFTVSSFPSFSHYCGAQAFTSSYSSSLFSLLPFEPTTLPLILSSPHPPYSCQLLVNY